MTVKDLFTTLPLFFVGLAAVTSLISFKYDYPIVLKKLSLFWIFNFSVDLAGHITKHLGIKNHWLYNIYFWVMYVTLAYLYDQQIKSRQVHLATKWFHILFPVLVLLNSILFGIKDLQSVVIVTGDVFMIFLSVCYFRQLYLSEENENIARDPWFWFSFGFIIHFGGTVSFLGMLNYLWRNYKEFTNFYYLYFSNSFTILLNILIIFGFLCIRNSQKSR